MTALGRDELPLAGVLVEAGQAGSGRTDAEGRLVLEGVPHGLQRVRLVEPGVVYAEQGVRVDEGGTVAVTLREGIPYDLEVTVRDESGAPARFARIDVDLGPGVPWVHLLDGVQTLTVMTDERGRCFLPELPRRTVTITARFGSRRATARVAPGTHLASLTLGRDGAAVW